LGEDLEEDLEDFFEEEGSEGEEVAVAVVVAFDFEDSSVSFSCLMLFNFFLLDASHLTSSSSEVQLCRESMGSKWGTVVEGAREEGAPGTWVREEERTKDG